MTAVDEAKRRAMSRQRRRDTGPELAVRRRLHALGYRYRVDHRPLPDLRARGDLVFTRARVVVFVDGCFWHRCPQHATSPAQARTSPVASSTTTDPLCRLSTKSLRTTSASGSPPA